MSKILPTIGPASESIQDIRKMLNISNTIRINGSHNTLSWHKKIANDVKKLKRDSTILLDVPGIKPRTANQEEILINKGEKIIFTYKNYKIDNKLKVIQITNPLPKINKKARSFSISDGQYEFRITKYGKNFIEGKSNEKFLLKPKKGLNIPFSIYDENAQFRIYSNFIKKFKSVKFDALGFSFVQSDSILKKIKKKFKNIVIVAKIENYLGLKNANNICKHSDVIMIDRGDLGAEIGNNKLYSAIVTISEITKQNGKSLIMATENLNSMITRKSPTKSEIVALGFTLSLKADKIMLSDETATSKNWYSSLVWLNNFLKQNKYPEFEIKNDKDTFWKIISELPSNIPIVVFSRKGLAIEKLSKIKGDVDLTIFTDSIKTSTICSFRSYAKTFYISKFDESKKNTYIYSALKKYKNTIFKKNKSIILIYISYPRKASRANTIALVEKKDFN
jgi:pyruvate kinase